MQLKDKVVIVTGSTTGIGEAIARLCVAQGASVLVHGRDEQRAKELADELGESVAYHIDDMADAEAPGRIVTTAISKFGRIDGLVNNAGWSKRSDLTATDADLFDSIMAVNARGPMLLVQSAIEHLIKSQGSVVGIGSINSYTGEPQLLPYSMSKAAHGTMSRNLANVYGRQRVRFNHLNVGWVLTENEYQLKIKEGLSEDWPEQVAKTHCAPSGRMTKPEDIAQHVLFWLSDASRPITGSMVDLEQYPVVGRMPMAMD